MTTNQDKITTDQGKITKTTDQDKKPISMARCHRPRQCAKHINSPGQDEIKPDANRPGQNANRPNADIPGKDTNKSGLDAHILE